MKFDRYQQLCFFIALMASVAEAAVQVTVDKNEASAATSEFKFKSVAQPSRNDAAAGASFLLVSGRRDRNGADLEVLHDGRGPESEDEPTSNFFFAAGTSGGRVVVDLGTSRRIKQVNTYSWHANTRGPQVYVLYASDGQSTSFNSKPAQGTEPAEAGWTRVAEIDTRPKTDNADMGGQYGVSISDSAGAMGPWRYLLFEILPTETKDTFGHSFFSEIDVVELDGPAPLPIQSTPTEHLSQIVEIEGGKYRITIDTTEAPDLTEWARTRLAPVVAEWYPKLVTRLPSEGFEPQAKVSIVFSKMSGVAATSGGRIRCAAAWFRRNLEGEAVGSVVHEMVHVVQSYGRTRRTNPNATRAPGWLTEAISDYIRWYEFEPQSKGAEIRSRDLSRVRYDASYRVSANFLNWVIGKYDPDLIRHLNAALRKGEYREDLWTRRTRHTLPELGAEWKDSLGQQLQKASITAPK